MKTAFTAGVGDRDLPLEADLEDGILDRHPLVGDIVEVTPVAGGDLLELRGQKGEITGVMLRLGQVVGLRVRVDKKSVTGTMKDFFVGRKVLEDIQPPTPTEKSVRETLVHWGEQRTYWHTRMDGVEALCFELASVTPRALIQESDQGWKFLIPDPMPSRRVAVDCRVALHDKFWTLSVMVYSENKPLPEQPPLIENHWGRTFYWAFQIGKILQGQGLPWKGALSDLQKRAVYSLRVLTPLMKKELGRSLALKRKLTGTAPEYPPGSICIAVSNLRLKPGYAGLTDPPTDRRPYTVISISEAATEDPEYLQQVVLHECIHAVVYSKGGEPHNKEFKTLAKALGLSPKYWD